MSSERHSKAEATESGKASDLDAACRVLMMEATALQALAADLSGDSGAAFGAALDLLEAVSGRVIVTGMGKSGHVARKIAATLASTGSPAQYVHPGEASHGDLGMITAKDAVLALSNSGETVELGDILAYSRRFSIPLIALTSRAGSTLAKTADVALVLPDSPEACPMGLAPTTSTTLMLALGDALAVALIERRNFSATDFSALHPGGSLGKRLQKVADLMHPGEEVPLVQAQTPMSEALLIMTRKSFGCVGVVEENSSPGAGRLLGIITDGDLRRHMAPDLLQYAVETVMTPAPKVIGPQALADEALALMNHRSITSLFVVDAEQRPVGIIHIHDCLRAGIL